MSCSLSLGSFEGLSQRPRLLTLGLLLCSALAPAQEPRPEVAPFPLEIVRTSEDATKKDSEDLRKLLPMMLRAAAAAVPDSAKLTAALADLSCKDCDRDDTCLAQLAKLSGSLYGFYGRLDFDLDGNVVAMGRVVRDDGRAVRAPKTVTLARGAASFRDTAQAAMKQLLSELEVGQLPPFRPQEPLAEAPPPLTSPFAAPAPAPALAPLPVLVRPTASPLRAVGLAGAGAGVACMIAGGVLFGTAGVARTEVSQGVVRVLSEDAAKVPAIQRAQTAGIALLAVGAGLAVVGAGLSLFGPGKPVTTVVPLNAGAAVLIEGALP